MTAYVEVKKEDFEHLKKVVDESCINVQLNIEKREGYHGGTDNAAKIIGSMRFVSSKETRHVRELDKRDLNRIKASIYYTREKADYVMVSLHSREMGRYKRSEAYGTQFIKNKDGSIRCVL